MYIHCLHVPSTSVSDIDECSGGTDECHIDASCNNTIGGYDCTCNDGFFGDGFNCTGMSLALCQNCEYLPEKAIFHIRLVVPIDIWIDTLDDRSCG